MSPPCWRRDQCKHKRRLPPGIVVRRPGVSPPPLKLPSKRWRDLILRVWHVDLLRCPSHLVGTSIHHSSFILHPFRPALASSGPVCPGIALLLAHCLAAWSLPPSYGLGDGAKPPENRQNLPVAALHQLWQDGAGMNESEKQFSFTRATPSTSGRAKSKFSNRNIIRLQDYLPGLTP